MRYQWISRLLAKALIDTDAVIAPFAREVLARAGADGRTLVLIIDQSQINTEHQMVMVSLRVGGRALPLAWRVKKTSGAIGFAEQRAALDRGAARLPPGGGAGLMGGRFYGSPPPVPGGPGAGRGRAAAGQEGALGVVGGGGGGTPAPPAPR